MLKVFLVEDEAVIRNSIVKSVDWENEGFELAGSAGDGELAWPQIRETRPDIVVTDIRMPFMDGLELSKLVKKEFPHAKILILSGFNEFDYAKEAIQIGVSDYLLKPISADKLVESLHKVGDEIIEERKSHDMIMNYTRRLEEEDNKKAENQTPVDVEEVNPKALNKTTFFDFLIRGNRDDISGFIDKYLDELGRNNLRSVLFRQYVISDLYLTCNAYLDDLGAPKEEKIAILGSMEDAGKAVAADKTGLREKLEDLLCSIIDYRNLNREAQLSSQILKASSYIREHYGEDDISLNQVADVAGMSPSHFSAVFKQETGEGFSEYLTEVRMEAAKRLLATTDFKMTEIAEQAGYHDSHYFSSTFKKTQGMTPKDYRAMVKGN
ncbi:MAG: response regulator [Lachnospiraceae bacterium]|uniref:Stage 0 sporulation protein A homolog n=1 Tax=Candidatus Weimeria bifida TaxID=2599074 RepID=A0A6N7J3P8_9FIRM|nr:response regulator [Candidatus Weimeria bifida]RRF96168.1 MAG: response regulator [Lachnospiraceae bacterium]